MAGLLAQAAESCPARTPCYAFHIVCASDYNKAAGPVWNEMKCTNRHFLRRVNNSYHTESWEQMTAIKSRILRIWDGASPSVKLCCVKFAQRVVLAQTPSNGADQRVSASLFPTGSIVHGILTQERFPAKWP